MTEDWLNAALPQHERLTQAVITIVQNILSASEVDILSITGRTKTRQGAIEKIKRKGYQSPETQLTDITGVRIVLFSETDVRKAAELISTAFTIDHSNSLNQDDLLSTNQTGYRSIHFVCDLGAARGALPEFAGLSGRPFEVQVRTVLQHAWAELSHDRNYKFTGKLPRELERRIYLYAGMLEIADKGFDDLSREIDKYASDIAQKSEEGDLSTELNSISLPQFAELWGKKNGVPVENTPDATNYSDLIQELNQFGVHTIDALKKLAPERYSLVAQSLNYSTNVYGLVRDWMLLHDWRRFHRDIKRNWFVPPDGSDNTLFASLMPTAELAEFYDAFSP